MIILSFERLLTWDERLEVGQPHLDAQHKAIFKIAMEVADLSQDAGQVQRLCARLYRLDDALAHHFSDEEQQLAELECSGIEQHKAEHALMRQELRSIRDRLIREGPGAFPIAPGSAVRNLVLGVTMGHMFQSDLGVGAFLHQAAGARTCRNAVLEPLERPCPSSVDLRFRRLA